MTVEVGELSERTERQIKRGRERGERDMYVSLTGSPKFGAVTLSIMTFCINAFRIKKYGIMALSIMTSNTNTVAL
jgi:hypothetical protein